MRVDHGRAYGRQGSGAWREVDNAADTFAPGGDPLGFLAGASNIRLAGTETRQFGDDETGLSLSHTRYTFDFDGAAFIDHLGELLADQLRQRGQCCPAWTSTPTPTAR
jgi:hypothetical protein